MKFNESVLFYKINIIEIKFYLLFIVILKKPPMGLPCKGEAIDLELEAIPACTDWL